MRRSFVLRANPTVRQTQAILGRLERALVERGSTVQRETPGAISFRMPPPWRLARVGWLGLVTSGTATLSAWGGGPWRVSYRLYFGALQGVTGVLTLAMVILGWEWPRLALLSSILALWIVGYGSLYLLASRDFRMLLRESMSDVVERRKQPRPTPTGTPERSQQPE